MFRMFRLSTLAVIVVMLVAGAAAPTADVEVSYRALPDDLVAVVHADVRALVDSELYRSLSDRFGENPLAAYEQFREFVDATGFRFETDLASVTLGIGGELADDSPPFYMLVDGKFDRQKIDAYLLDGGEYDRNELHGLTAFVPKAAEDGSEIQATLAWLDDDTLLVASSPEFGKLARSIDGRAPNAADSVLSRLLTEAEGQIRLAMILPEAAERNADKATPPSVMHGIVESVRNSPLAQLQSIMLTLNAGSGLDVTVQGKADTPENGGAVYEMLNGYLAMGRMMAAENPQIGEILDHLKLEREESGVSLAISMTGDEIRAVIEESQSQPVVVKPDGS